MGIDELTLDDLGLPPTTEVLVDRAHAQRVAATLDANIDLVDGSPLPSLWHWAYFTPTAPSSQLGHDGHPRLASPRLAAFPRRMWGAGEVTWYGALQVGSPAVRITSVTSVKRTEGASGALLIVGLQHQYHQHDALIIEEQQSIVYRTPGDAVPRPIDTDAPPVEEGVVQREQCPDAALLFRFSAITFNTHRIHYDQHYATDVEGYPGLVVHGPLTSLQLAHHVEATHGASLAWWRFKATAPMFADCRQWFQCRPVDGDAEGEARVVRNDGAVAMTAQYRLEPPRG